MERAIYTGRSRPGRECGEVYSACIESCWVEPGMPLGTNRDLGLLSQNNNSVQKILVRAC